MSVRNLKEPGRYADGNGLYLVVDRSGARRWILRTVVQGHRRDLGLGGVSLVGLAEARSKAAELRLVARSGGDPLANRRRAQAVPTFAEAAELVHAERKPGWRNPKHADQWINTLRQYANPVIGTFRVNAVGTPDIMRILTPIWLTKAETARRLRQRIGVVMEWAKAHGYRGGDNPVSGVANGLPKQSGMADHHAAMPFAEVPQFLAMLRSSTEQGEITRLALQFLILTAARTGEVLGARRAELDLASATWTVPADRMKAKRVHRVPLSNRAVEIVARANELAGESPFLFPGRTPDVHLSNMALAMTLRRMKIVDATVHGFRSSFRDWAAEATTYPREIAEMALAHTIESKVEAAYRRGDLFNKRAAMMEDWSEFGTREN